MPAALADDVRRHLRRFRRRRDEPVPRFGLPLLAATRRPDGALTVGVLVYRGVTTSEIDEPVRALAARLGADVRFVGEHVGPLPGVEPAREVLADAVPSTVGRVDVLVVPGGLGWRQVIDTPALRDWIGHAAVDADALLAISTGSLLVASVGRLTGREATGHWLAERELQALGAVVRQGRTASDEAGRVVTASGSRAAMQVVDAVADRVRWSGPAR